MTATPEPESLWQAQVRAAKEAFARMEETAPGKRHAVLFSDINDPTLTVEQEIPDWELQGWGP